MIATQSNKAQQSELKGREKYLNWIESKPECTHLKFSNDPFAIWDMMFYSAGTVCIGDIKDRNYDSHFFIDFGAEIDLSKARNIRDLAATIEAKPIIITTTSDNKHIISDLTIARAKDVRTQEWQANDDTHFTITKQTLNLKRCTIK